MTAVAPKSPAPQAAAVSGSAHHTPAWSGGRVRNRRDRQRAARCFAGPEPVRGARLARSRRPESKASSQSGPARAVPFAAVSGASPGFGMAESP